MFSDESSSPQSEIMVVPRKWSIPGDTTDEHLFAACEFDETERIQRSVIDGKQLEKKVTYFVRNDAVIERCEYRNKRAVCYADESNRVIRRFSILSTIRHAVYTKVQEGDRSGDYLVCAYDNGVVFVALKDGRQSVVGLTFMVDKLHACDYGILIERMRVSGEETESHSQVHLFSLVHPFNEVLPVLYRKQHESVCHYAFATENVVLLPTTSRNHGSLYLGYDLTHGTHFLFHLRKCSPEERISAAKDISGVPFCFDTPNRSSISMSKTSFRADRSAGFAATPNTTAASLNLATPSEKMTPLRRSIRNQAKNFLDVAKTSTPLSAVFGNATANNTTTFNFRNQNLTGRNPFRVFNIDGDDTDSLDVDLIMVCVWSEPLLNTSMANLSLSNPVASKSILRTQMNSSHTPNRICFQSQDIIFQTPPSGKHSTPNLPHKKPIPLRTSQVLQNQRRLREEGGKENDNLTWAKFYVLKAAEKLAVVNALLKEMRKDLLMTSDYKGIGDAQDPDFGAEDAHCLMTVVELTAIRQIIAKHYLTKSIWETNANSVVQRQYFALLLAKKELQQLVKTEAGLRASELIGQRAALRFFVTADLTGQRYACFLPSGDEKLRMLKWDAEKCVVIGSPLNVDAYDACVIRGTKLVAVIKQDRKLVALYCGPNDVGTLYVPSFNPAEHILMTFGEGNFKVVNLMFQQIEANAFKSIHLSVDSGCSAMTEQIVEAIAGVLPTYKAVKFYAGWMATNKYNTPESGNSPESDPLVELPLLFEYVFSTMGLKFEGLNSFSEVAELRRLGDTPEANKRGRLASSTDPAMSQDDAGTPRPISVKVYEGRDAFLDRHSFVVFHTLHLFFEGCSFYIHNKAMLMTVVEPLYAFALATHLDNYVYHYGRRYPALNNRNLVIAPDVVLPNLDDAASFHPHALQTVESFYYPAISFHPDAPLPVIPKSPFWPTPLLFCVLVASGRIHNMSTLRQCLGSNWHKRLAISEDVISGLLHSSALSKATKCYRCMKALNITIGDFYGLIPQLVDVVSEAAKQFKTAGERLWNKNRLVAPLTERQMQQIVELKWPTDMRLENAIGMLLTHKSTLVPIKRPAKSYTASSDDEDYNDKEKVERFVIFTFPKTIARLFGFGVLMYRSKMGDRIDFSHTNPIDFSCKLLTGTTKHDIQQEVLNKHIDWINFFTGAAKTLALCGTEMQSSMASVIKAWHDDPDIALMTTGAVFAYGIMGMLKSINWFSIHHMIITSKKPQDVMAILLGCAITWRGTGNLQLHRAITSHLPAFMDPTTVEFKFDPGVQIAAILSLGFVFQGTTASTLTNKLINEMAKDFIFDFDSSNERYSYVLAAGIAVGLVNLGKGNAIVESQQPIAGGYHDIEQRLFCLLRGQQRMRATDFGKRNKDLCNVQRKSVAALNSNNISAVTGCSNVDFGLVHGIGIANESAAIGTLYGEAIRYTSNIALGQLDKQSSQVLETRFVNTHQTAPAACIAIALMYMRSSNPRILKALRIPDTLPELERIRPDIVMMRTMCSIIVDYDNVVPEPEYLDQYMPKHVQSYLDRYNTFRESELDKDLDDYEKQGWFFNVVDMTTVFENHIYIRAGICLGLGIRYASTNNKRAFEYIFKFFQQVSPEPPSRPPQAYQTIRPSIVAHCASMAVVALSLITAASGDLRTMRVIRLQRNCFPDASYGSKDNFTKSVYSTHVFCNMALGFLFLGNCRFGFAHTDEAIAALVVSLFPLFPQHVSDNRYYFQPLRLIWPLAVEYRLLTAVDSRTLKHVRMHAEFTMQVGRNSHPDASDPESSTGESKAKNDRFKTSHPMRLQLPAVIPPLEEITTIKLYANGYEAMILNVASEEEHLKKLKQALQEYHGQILVKKLPKPYSDCLDETPVFRSMDFADLEDIEPNTSIPYASQYQF